MSEAKLISPLLDGFLMGSPMSDHNGVQCCPAMKEDSDHRYIVKIISVPASQKQLDALLLAGAYRKAEDAMPYFKELADGVVAEAQCLQDLAKLEGFQSYEGWQVEPMDRHDIGYRVYLLSSYRRSLEKHMRRTMLTHLDAINLGLDLCSALSTVRRAGYIYVDLKPTNIFLGEDKSCRIGDLGFISRDAFRYTALPGKYISAYTAPELRDPMSDLNETVDTYALGMVLYQIYNDGQLPPQPEDPSQPYPTPVNADYELAEIILKALSPKPEDRYQDPQEMGKALDCYMQRNSVNETPVTPPSTVIYDPEDMVKEEPEAAAPEESAPEEASQEEPAAEPTVEQIQQEVLQEETEAPADETMPTAEDAPLPEEKLPLTEETSSMVAQADDLLSHEIPEGVDVPDPDNMEDPFASFLLEEEDWTETAQPPQEEILSDPIAEERRANEPAKPKKHSKLRKVFTRILVTLLILGILGGGGYFYYSYFFLQTIEELKVENGVNGITVTVKTDVDPSLLTVSCTDDALNVVRQPLVNGSAQFMELEANMPYHIALEIEGFHMLKGQTSADITTQPQTDIQQFTAAAGSEEGSVILDFISDGPEPNEWAVTYTTQGEPPMEEIFSGHNLTIIGLTPGKTYTFLLGTHDDKVISGNNTAQFTVASPSTAKNVKLVAESEDTLLATWEMATGSDVTSWIVHCFNEEGYSETQEIFGNEARFSGVDPSMAYTVEVTAKDGNLPARATISANPITITNIVVDDSEDGQLNLSWEFTGAAPADGWVVTYGLDTAQAQNVIECDSASAVISPRIPGTTYYITIQTHAESSITGNTTEYALAEAPEFNEHSLSASRITAKLLKTPEDPDWTASTVSADSYTDTFQPGDPISMVIHAGQNFYTPNDPMTIVYVLRDAGGRVLPKLVTKEEVKWNEIWLGGDRHDAELDLPVAPFNEGKYSITLYFDGAFAASAEFTIAK